MPRRGSCNDNDDDASLGLVQRFRPAPDENPCFVPTHRESPQSIALKWDGYGELNVYIDGELVGFIPVMPTD